MSKIVQAIATVGSLALAAVPVVMVSSTAYAAVFFG